MTWLRLALANLALSPLTSAVNVTLMGLGTSSIVLLLLAGHQLAESLTRDAGGIDLVVGAKGSPVQLVLSAVYHADVPPGNIRSQDAQRLVSDPRIATAVPLSMGDNYRGLRIVGTTESYPSLYGAELTGGRFWKAPMEAVVGSMAARSTGLALDSRFTGAHGLVDAGHSHDARPYRVVGVLRPSGTVLDRLILTSLESVWHLHGGEPPAASDHSTRESDHHDGHDQGPSSGHDDQADGQITEADAEITAMLIRYRSPLAALTLPREVNAVGALQAASPAMEIGRVLQLVSVGLDGLRAFAGVLVATAALSVFAALYGSLRARRGELAMLRCLGATRSALLLVLLLEGLLLSLLGVALGLAAGHGAMALIGGWLEATRGVALSGWSWAPSEGYLVLGLLGVGVLAAAIPAAQAYRTDVSRTLAEG